MASGGQGFLGQIVSGSGAGPYTVTLNPQASSPGPNVQAMIPQIDASQTVPAGTFVIVVQSGNNYYMQPPVWLAPA